MKKLKIVNGLTQDYTIVLSTRDMRHLGQLGKLKAINENENLNSADEISFSVYKYDLLKSPPKSHMSPELHMRLMMKLWEQIEDLKLVWVKELNKYFEIRISIDDSAETIKNVTGISLCEAELSQININNLEINSESDILRDDYVVTTFYNDTIPQASLLNRVISDKAPHYKIKHVDESLKKIQRTFSVSNSNIYNFLTGEVSEQFNCLFVFDSSDRSISAYDLYTVCEDCGYREDFQNECPKCGGKNLKYFGEDTTILVDKTNLTDSVQLEADTDSIKNCFKLVAGDELMTSTIKLLNQNGSDYIYQITDYQKKDMPEELVKKLSSYDTLYNSYTEEYENLLKDYYDYIDRILYLESGMMPTVEDAEVTARTEADKLTVENLSPVSISKVTASTSTATVNSALKNYANVYIKSGYVKIEIADGATFQYVGEKSEYNKVYNYGTWRGRFIVTNYSDDEDVVTTDELEIMVNDDHESFIRQKILKSLEKDIEDDDSVFDVLAIEDLDKFKEAVNLYGKNRLTSFYDAIQGALDILVQMDEGQKDALLYETLYLPYYNKLVVCQDELDERQAEIQYVRNDLDAVQERMNAIQEELDFKKYLGDYYTVFCSYRREDTYDNSNYISDGLNNVELIDRAKEFLETARKELKRASEPQFSLHSTLHNLLVLDEFKPIVDHFELGNWIRVKVDGFLYRLRLISYSIHFDNLQSIDVEFSTVSKVKDIVEESKQIIQSAKSMSSSYSYVSKQAENGNKAQISIGAWKQSGLDSSLIAIKNNENEEVTYGKHGILCRTKDDITGEYDPKQTKILHNVIAFTSDDWKTVRQILGEHSYKSYNPITNTIEEHTGYGVTADFLVSSFLSSMTIVGGEIYSSNYRKADDGSASGTHIDLESGSFSFAGGGLTYDPENGLKIDSLAIEDSLYKLNITAANLKIKAKNIDTSGEKISMEQIASIPLSKIQNTDNGLITSDQVKSLDASKIVGSIGNLQIENVDASKISGLITSDQIESMDVQKITGTIPSEKVAATLEDKTLNNAILSGFVVSSNGSNYSGVTGNYNVGDNTLEIVHGVIVNVTPIETPII